MQRISNRQLILIGISYILSITLVSLPSQIISVARQDAWLTYIVAGVVIFFSILMLGIVLHRFPEHDLFSALVKRFPIGGRGIVSLYVLFFFFILARDIRILVDFTNNLILPKTPIMVLGLIIIFTVILAMKGGIEVLARLTELFLPVFIIGLFIFPIISINDFNFKFLQPVLASGFGPILKGSWLAFPYLGELIALPIIFSHRTFRVRTGLTSLSIITVILLISIILNLLMLGEPVSSKLIYPNHELVKLIKVTDILDRFELLVLASWSPIILTRLGISLYIVCYGLKCLIPSLSQVLIATPIGFLALICSYWFYENYVQILNFNRSWPVLAIVFQLVIPLILFLIMRPKKSNIEQLLPQKNN